MDISNKPNCQILLDMTFSELIGVSEEWEEEDSIVSWVVDHSSYIYKGNGEGGIYDFIFNLAMLESYIDVELEKEPFINQIRSIRDSGVGYILFNNGC